MDTAAKKMQKTDHACAAWNYLDLQNLRKYLIHMLIMDFGQRIKVIWLVGLRNTNDPHMSQLPGRQSHHHCH